MYVRWNETFGDNALTSCGLRCSCEWKQLTEDENRYELKLGDLCDGYLVMKI